MLVMSGPDEEELAFEDLVDAEHDQTTTPDRRGAPEPDLALGSDIHEVPPQDGPFVDRKPLDGIDAVLVAYLLDLDDGHVDEPPRPDAEHAGHPDSEVTKDGRPKRP